MMAGSAARAPNSTESASGASRTIAIAPCTVRTTENARIEPRTTENAVDAPGTRKSPQRSQSTNGNEAGELKTAGNVNGASISAVSAEKGPRSSGNAAGASTSARNAENLPRSAGNETDTPMSAGNANTAPLSAGYVTGTPKSAGNTVNAPRSITAGAQSTVTARMPVIRVGSANAPMTPRSSDTVGNAQVSTAAETPATHAAHTEEVIAMGGVSTLPMSRAPPFGGADLVNREVRLPRETKKCGYTRCRNRTVDLAQFQCIAHECEKGVHATCYSLLRLEMGVSEEESGTIKGQVCTRRCLKKLRKLLAEQRRATSSRKQRVLWTQDGSLAVLMNWLTTEGNYEKYTGGSGSEGRTKDSYHSEIKRIIDGTQGCTERLEKDIASKIASLERAFRDASDWLNNTGAGLSDPGEIRTYVLKKWPQYYDLEPVMSERPNTRPLSTNEDNLGDSDADREDNARNGNSQPSLLNVCENSSWESRLRSEGLLNDDDDDITPDNQEDDNAQRVQPPDAHEEDAATPVSNRGRPDVSLLRNDSRSNSRRRLSLTSSGDGAERRTKKKRKSKKLGGSDSNFGLLDSSQLLDLRRDELALKREEIDSRKQVDSATATKLRAETDFAEARARRERQQARFELMKQAKELRDMGFTQDEIDATLGSQ